MVGPRSNLADARLAETPVEFGWITVDGARPIGGIGGRRFGLFTRMVFDLTGFDLLAREHLLLTVFQHLA